MSDSVATFSDVTRRFAEVTAVEDLSLEIARGETVALLGLAAYLASPAAAQPVPRAPTDTMRVGAGASEAAAYPLEAGEPVAAWVESGFINPDIDYGVMINSFGS